MEGGFEELLLEGEQPALSGVGSSVTSEGDWDSVASLVSPMQCHIALGGQGKAQTLGMCSFGEHYQWVASVSRCLSSISVLAVVSQISGLISSAAPPPPPDRAQTDSGLPMSCRGGVLNETCHTKATRPQTL